MSVEESWRDPSARKHTSQAYPGVVCKQEDTNICDHSVHTHDGAAVGRCVRCMSIISCVALTGWSKGIIRPREASDSSKEQC